MLKREITGSQALIHPAHIAFQRGCTVSPPLAVESPLSPWPPLLHFLNKFENIKSAVRQCIFFPHRPSTFLLRLSPGILYWIWLLPRSLFFLILTVLLELALVGFNWLFRVFYVGIILPSNNCNLGKMMMGVGKSLGLKEAETRARESMLCACTWWIPQLQVEEDGNFMRLFGVGTEAEF